MLDWDRLRADLAGGSLAALDDDAALAAIKAEPSTRGEGDAEIAYDTGRYGEPIEIYHVRAARRGHGMSDPEWEEKLGRDAKAVEANAEMNRTYEAAISSGKNEREAARDAEAARVDLLRQRGRE